MVVFDFVAFETLCNAFEFLTAQMQADNELPVYSVLEKLLCNLNEDDKTKYLRTRSRFGAGILHRVFLDDRPTCSGMSQLPSNDHLKVLELLLRNTHDLHLASETDRYEENILHKAIQIRSLDTIKIILGNVGELEIVQMLWTRNNSAMSPLDYLFCSTTESRFRVDVLTAVVGYMSCVNVCDILLNSVLDDKSVFQKLLSVGDSRTLIFVLDFTDRIECQLSHETFESPQVLYDFISSNFCCNKEYEAANVLDRLLQPMRPDDAYSLLQRESIDGDSLMHSILRYCDPTFAYIVLRTVHYDQRHSLLVKRNRLDETPFHSLFSGETTQCDCNMCVSKVSNQCEMMRVCLGLVPPSYRVSTLVLFDF